MSEHKNKLLLAIVIAAIAVILLGTVSYTFFPAEPKTQSPKLVMSTHKPVM
jgi:hypothetical protein